MRERLVGIMGLSALALGVGVACAQPAAAPAATTAAKPAATQPAGATAAATTAAAAKPVGPQVMTAGLVGVGPSPDLYNLSAQSARNWAYHVGQGLITLDSGEPKGLAAASFRTTDPTTWEFKIANQKFSTGETVTADDVVFSFQRALSTRNGVPEFPLAVGALATMDKVTATAADTVTFTTKGADPIFPNKITPIFILSKKAFDTMPLERAALVGSGPFAVQTFSPSREVVTVQNPNFVGTKPTLTQITFKEVPDTTVRFGAVRSGELDAAEAVGLNNAKTLVAPNKSVVRPADLVTGALFDVRAPQLKSKEVRQGLNHAVDRKQIIDGFLDGKVPPANQIVTTTTFGYAPGLPAFDFNQARARQLIAAGGFPNGFQLTLGYAPIVADYKNFAEALQGAWGQVGVRTDLELIDPAQFIPRFLQLTLPPTFMSSLSSSNYLDALEAMRFRAVPPTSAYYGNDAFNALFAQASVEVDRTKRQGLMQSAMRMTNDDPPGFLGWGFAEAWAVGPKLVGFDSLPATQLPQWQTMSIRNP